MIVETGLKETDANSYVSVDFADQYHAALGNADWTGTVADKEKALIIACQSLDLLYGPKYMSYRLDGIQSLLWPRYPYIDRNSNIRNKQEVPIEVKRAQAELALMYMNGADLFPEGNDTFRIGSETTKVGDIETSTTYLPGKTTDAAAYVGFRKIDLLLWNVTKARQNSIRLAR